MEIELEGMMELHAHLLGLVELLGECFVCCNTSDLLSGVCVDHS